MAHTFVSTEQFKDIKMENATDKNLNKILAVCHDCAYGMISKGAKIDPILLK